MSASPFDVVAVAGGGIAGLLAAAAAARHAREVVVIDRDRLPAAPGVRSGTPQAGHAHGLLASGREAMEELLPGLVAALLEGGAVSSGDIGMAAHWYIGGGALAGCTVGHAGLAVSRPLLEAEIRSRVRALPNVRVIERADVEGLVADGDRVTGLRLRLRDRGDEIHCQEADLVIDAAGRAGLAARWLQDRGVLVPEDVVGIDVRYATTHLPWRAGDATGRAVVVSAATPDVPRGGVAIRQERGDWILTLFGVDGDQPPLDEDGFRTFAGAVVAPELAALLADRALTERPRAYRFPASRRRRFDQVEGPGCPAGLIALGDAICSFDPTFGQGMSVAARQAVRLDEELARLERVEPAPRVAAAAGGLSHLGRAGVLAGVMSGIRQGGAPGDAGSSGRTPRAGFESRFHRAAMAIAAPAWDLMVGADLQLPGATGTPPPGHAVIARYVRRVQRAARRDPEVARALLMVTNLLTAPPSLLSPRIALRAAVRGREARPQRHHRGAVSGRSAETVGGRA